MATKKTVSLSQSIAAMGPQKIVRTVPWYEKIRMQNPDLYQQLCEIVDEWNSSGHARNVFPAASSLHAFLIGESPDSTQGNLIGDVSPNTFRQWMKSRRGNK